MVKNVFPFASPIMKLCTYMQTSFIYEIHFLAGHISFLTKCKPQMSMQYIPLHRDMEESGVQCSAMQEQGFPLDQGTSQ